MQQTAPPPVPRPATPTEVLAACVRALEGGRRVVVATVLERRGSAPSTPGQKLILIGEDHALGTIGGGAVEHQVLEAMRDLLRRRAVRPRVVTHRLGPSLGMCCGGSVEVLMEPMMPRLDALLVGAGHIGRALAPRLVELGFRVVVCDAREEALDASGLSEGDALRTLLADHDDPEVIAALATDRSLAAMVVATHDHQLDQAVVEWALKRGFDFVGGVGSRAKAVRTRQRLEAKGFDAAEIDRVQMPVGVAIGARTPAEIAISIAAELVRWRAERLSESRAKNVPGAYACPDGASSS